MSNYGTGGDAANRGERSEDEPAATVTSKADRMKWAYDRPAPTITTTRRSSEGILVGRQLEDGSRRDVGGHEGGSGLKRGQLPGVRITIQEAAILQSYPADFEFAGTKGKQFLQVGNAVPPLLAKALIDAVLATGAESGLVEEAA